MNTTEQKKKKRLQEIIKKMKQYKKTGEITDITPEDLVLYLKHQNKIHRKKNMYKPYTPHRNNKNNATIKEE